MILDFFKNAANLKNIPRQGWIYKLSIDDPESVADHSYSMAMMGMVISDLENYDSEKILKMALLHDLAESKIGDYTPEQIDKEKKMELENSAFVEIVKNLPNIIKSQYLQIWKEYPVVDHTQYWRHFQVEHYAGGYAAARISANKYQQLLDEVREIAYFLGAVDDVRQRLSACATIGCIQR
ncbi:MAG: HD domain-containing protein, partial [Thaumarchaeota archaeon]|nr:HD domain-containing protein [Nitrososphaerota archaeon]